MEGPAEVVPAYSSTLHYTNTCTTILVFIRGLILRDSDCGWMLGWWCWCGEQVHPLFSWQVGLFSKRQQSNNKKFQLQNAVYIRQINEQYQRLWFASLKGRKGNVFGVNGG